MWAHPELGCSLVAMDALGLTGAREGSGAAERGLQGNYVCIQVKLVKLTARREGKHREGVNDLDMLLIDLPASA